ncbi:hypothetical protein [Dactylosporangium darangshiense]|uniref:Uncharacterized protein n=1 Tax=Dactylosporangium darangshiense TaxID=579108 RepID=A0ABP8DU63_9ACTN
MTQAVEKSSDQLGDFHQLLLRMAGRLPDELISVARRWLAEGELVEIAQTVVFGALTGRVALTEADAELLAQTLTAAGEDVDALADVELSEVDPQPLYGLAPVSPEVLDEYGDEVPYSIDLTVPYEGPGQPDEVDAVLAAAVADALEAGTPAVALWRCWRFPAIDTQWPPPRRMYLVQADDPAVLPALTAQLQAALEDVGEENPQVEVFFDADELPAYQRTALGFSALLWMAWAATPLLVARVFDTYDEQEGAGFDAMHPLLDEDERDHVLAYLDEGVPLLIAPGWTEDVVDRTRGDVVPTAFRTDGRWIWTDAVAYYLREHSLAPDLDLLDQIRGRGYAPPEVSVVELHRALAALYAPVVDEDVFDEDVWDEYAPGFDVTEPQAAHTWDAVGVGHDTSERDMDGTTNDRAPS